MMSPSRWPLHPAPKEGEALSSWLNRVAACYHMDILDLIECDLGKYQIDDLDVSPSQSLLTKLSKRGGVEIERLHYMTFAGWVPWLIDSLDNRVPEALETYAFQFSVLLPRHNRKSRSITNWRAWLPIKPINRACPHCLYDSEDQAVLLSWKLPLMLSCPLHGCFLKSNLGVPGRLFDWVNDDEPKMANDSIIEMDRRTWEALTKGYVELPHRRINAGLWFRLLRTLLDELNTPLSYCGVCASSVRYIWHSCGYPTRAGQKFWRPYEILDLSVQMKMLEATAEAIHLIEAKMVIPHGKQSELFMPELKPEFTDGLSLAERERKLAINHWQEVIREINNVMAEARRNPETARSLFLMVSLGRSDPEFIKSLRETFIEAGISPNFLSH